MLRRSFVTALACALSAAAFAAPSVIINEVMYHPPEDQDALQYIELFNTSGEEQNISGWKFANGPKFTFPENTVIPPRKFLVLCRDLNAFKRVYGSAIPAI